jgi:serine/threonine protein kinase/superfamily II DNA or RNA helicase
MSNGPLVVAGFRAIRELGRGGMGATHLAENHQGVRAVIKQALGDLSGELQEQLAREARFLGSLKHPRLPAVLAYEQGCMVLEYIDGQTVQQHIEGLRRKKGWSELDAHLRQVANWTLQMADVLDFLHTLKPRPLIHRDIKALNVMVRPSGELCLIDFGIARQFDEEKLRQGGADTVAFFSPGWTAPEFETNRQTTPRSDLYMLGVLMHYWLSGEQPDDTIDPRQRKPLTPLPARPHPLWTGLVAILTRLRHIDPDQRYPDARAVASHVKRILGETDEPASLPCPRCRQDVRASNRFCPRCGTRIRKAGLAPADQPSSGPVAISITFSPDHDRTRDRITALADAGTPAALDRFRVYQQLRELEQDPGFGELLSLDSLPRVERLPHQVGAVKTALQRMRGWCLLADEVGLGKTIEAGLIIKELMHRGLARKVLILAPKDLCTQWQQELFDKFQLFFLVFGKDVDYSLAWQCDRVIAPYKVAEDRFHRLELLAQKYDLVVMDEAHHLIMHDDRRGPLADFRRQQLHAFAKELKKNYFLMLSATPLHEDMQDLYELLTLLKPGSVGDFAGFKDRFVDPNDPLKPRNVQELRRRLDEVMIRQQRRQIAGLKFPRREALRVGVDLAGPARQVFDDFRDLVVRELWPASKENRPLRHSLQVLVEAFHSSPRAFANLTQDLHRRFRKLLGPTVHGALVQFQERLTGDLVSAKVNRAAEILRRSAGAGKVLVFSQYEDTAQMLARELPARTGLPVARYPGLDEADDGGTKALEALHAFRNHAAALVCTENASEGLNLQFASSMINFDLPWDPMKLEQRIGRIQRLGQASDRVFIYNLFLSGTVEEEILEVLDRKIEMFSATVGRVEEILGNLAEDESFDQVFLDLYLGDASAAGQIDIMVSASQHGQTSKADQLLDALFGGDATPTAAPAPTCRSCGATLAPGMRFCDQCRAEVNA